MHSNYTDSITANDGQIDLKIVCKRMSVWKSSNTHANLQIRPPTATKTSRFDQKIWQSKTCFNNKRDTKQIGQIYEHHGKTEGVRGRTEAMLF
jgi:hypothetical protein